MFRQAVTHLGLSRAEGLRPEGGAVAFDRYFDRDRLELRVDHKFRTERTGAKLGAARLR